MVLYVCWKSIIYVASITQDCLAVLLLNIQLIWHVKCMYRVLIMTCLSINIRRGLITTSHTNILSIIAWVILIVHLKLLTGRFT
jgi:hypothetical protein